MDKKIAGNCDFCYKPIPKKVDTCMECVKNMRELQKDPRLQELELDDYTLKNIVEFELPSNLEMSTDEFERTVIDADSEEEFREELEELFREMFGPDDEE